MYNKLLLVVLIIKAHLISDTLKRLLTEVIFYDDIFTFTQV